MDDIYIWIDRQEFSGWMLHRVSCQFGNHQAFSLVLPKESKIKYTS